MADELMDVTMPDGTVITDVPAGTTQSQLLSMYQKHTAAPKFQAQEDTVYSPEGIPLITPTTQGEPTGGAGTAAKVMTDIVGAPIRGAMSLAKPAANVMNWMGVKEPLQAIKQIDTGIKAQGPEFMGVQGPVGTAASLAGDINVYNKILGALGSAGVSASEAYPMLKPLVEYVAARPWLQSTLGGGAVGATSAETPFETIQQGGIGAGLGLLTHGALSGLGSALDPVLKRVKDLQAKGFTLDEIKKDTTIGQMLGGGVQAVENFFAALPFSGATQRIQAGAKSLQDTLESKIKALSQTEKATGNILGLTTNTLKTAEQRVIDDAKTLAKRDLDVKHAAEKEALKQTEADIHVPIINFALKPLGIEIPEGLTGNAAIKEGQKAISEAYNTALEGFSNLRLTKAIQSDLNSLTDTFNAGYLGKENAGLFKNDIKRLIDDTAKGKWLTPDNWQRQLSKLSKEAYNMRAKDPRYSEALYQLKDKWMDLVEGQVGSDLFRSANEAFSKFKIPERAAAYGKSIKAGGEFSPDELINSLRAELNTKRLAGGEDEIQKLAVDAHNTIKAARASQEEKHSLDKQNLTDIFTKKSRELEDKFTGIQENLAKQKATLAAKTQAKKEGLEKGVDEAVGDIGKMVSYPERRLIYQGAGLGGSGGLGFLGSQLGISPTASAIALGIPWTASNILYRPGPVQTLLKEAALAPRSEGVRQVGQALKRAAPLGSLATVQSFEESRKGHAEGGLIGMAGGGQPPKSDANEGSAFIGYPHINKNRKIGSGTGFLDALFGAPPSHENVLNPSDASYMEGYEKGEPYGLASMLVPFGGTTKAVGKATELAAPAINKSILHDIRNQIEQQGGSLAAKRFDRASDLVPGLERQYQPETLRNAFIGDNRNMFMVMDPADFERYASPISTGTKTSTSLNYRIGRPGPGQDYTHMPSGTYDDYIQYLQQFIKPGGGGFESRPSLEIGKREGFIFPNIQGHEGRHRTEALSRLGDKSTLVTLWPRSDFNDLPRRSQPEFLEAFLERIGGNRPMVMPQDTPGLKRGLIDLPEIFKEGGLAVGGRPKQSIAGALDQVGFVQGPNLSTMAKDYITNLPEVTAQNAIRTNEMVQKSMPYSFNPKDPFMAPNPNYDPKAAQEFNEYIPGLMGGVIKPVGGQWLSDKVRYLTDKYKFHDVLAPMSNRPNAEQIANMRPDMQEVWNNINRDELHNTSLNKWIDSNLTKYIKNQFGTEVDPIRKLADEGVSHIPLDRNYVNAVEPWTSVGQSLAAKRQKAGMPAHPLSETDLGKQWENMADLAINPESVQDLLTKGKGLRYPWLREIEDRNTPMHDFSWSNLDPLGFAHVIDILKQDLRAGNLRPEQLNRISVPDAVMRAHVFNDQQAKAMAKAKIKADTEMPVHKEYESGHKWLELKHPSDQQATEQALKYEGDTMGHCVGSYCPDVLGGKTKIYSLRDTKGEPHVTIEIKPKTFTDWDDWQRDLGSKKVDQMTSEDGWHNITMRPHIIKKYYDEAGIDINNLPPEIKQIKGKQNNAPKDEYLPFVQDFIKSGNWSDVKDIGNAKLFQTKDLEQLADILPKKESLQNLHKNSRSWILDRAVREGEKLPKYITRDEYEALLEKYNTK